MKRILIVDDEYAITSLLRAVLEEEGYFVATAENGQQGLDALAKLGADLAIIDVMMPVLDGIQMLDAMRADPSTRGIPVILMSAAHAAATTDRYDHTVFVDKPFDLDAILEIVSRLIG